MEYLSSPYGTVLTLKKILQNRENQNPQPNSGCKAQQSYIKLRKTWRNSYEKCSWIAYEKRAKNTAVGRGNRAAVQYRIICKNVAHSFPTWTTYSEDVCHLKCDRKHEIKLSCHVLHKLQCIFQNDGIFDMSFLHVARQKHHLSSIEKLLNVFQKLLNCFFFFLLLLLLLLLFLLFLRRVQVLGAAGASAPNAQWRCGTPRAQRCQMSWTDVTLDVFRKISVNSSLPATNPTSLLI